MIGNGGVFLKHDFVYLFRIALYFLIYASLNLLMIRLVLLLVCHLIISHSFSGSAVNNPMPLGK